MDTDIHLNLSQTLQESLHVFKLVRKLRSEVSPVTVPLEQRGLSVMLRCPTRAVIGAGAQTQKRLECS